MAGDGRFATDHFPGHRIPTVDTLELGRRRHHVPVLLEVDVTGARERLRAARARTGERLSLTGWVVACVARAVHEHPHVQGMRKGRREVVVFEDVDVAVIVEREVPGVRSSGVVLPGGESAADRARTETLPMPCIVREAQDKSVGAITAEIRAAQTEAVAPGAVDLGARRSPRLTRLFTAMPRILRHLLVWRPLLRDPHRARRAMGTVAVTSVARASRSSSQMWAIPVGLHPLICAVGGVCRKPGVVDGEVAIREFLSLTVLFDHDVTDGAPVARFLGRLTGLLEAGHGLGAADDTGGMPG